MENWYDEVEDVLNIQISDKKYWKSVEVGGVVVDVAKDGSIISIEIPQAKKVFTGEIKKVLDVAKLSA